MVYVFLLYFAWITLQVRKKTKKAIILFSMADFAVGAPYGGLDGNGAVFIYHGFEIRRGELFSEELKKPSQVRD